LASPQAREDLLDIYLIIALPITILGDPGEWRDSICEKVPSQKTLETGRSVGALAQQAQA
jgi:hypothetical protein